MSSHSTFLERLRAILIPTAPQALACLFLSTLILTLAQSRPLLNRIGLSTSIIDLGRNQFQTKFDAILRSPVASQLALIVFWAIVGLIAYLICWSLYNAYIEMRNQVTITTGYTNRADANQRHWRGVLETLALKTVAAAALTTVISTLWLGLSFWITLISQAVKQPELPTFAAAIGAVGGFSIELYLLLACVQLTFTPWYRPETFTDA